MPKVVLLDASCLIVFHKILKMELLKEVYPNLGVTSEVAKEFKLKLPDSFNILEANNNYRKLLETQLDSGEASMIAFALENSNTLLILDDQKARKLAKKLKLTISGTLGVISKAKKLGLISEVRPLLDEIRKTDFRLSKELIQKFLKLNNE